MVKGVSKTVIVVNNTGSKLFEKIVFYVTPEYGTLSAKQLKKAASSFSFHYDDSCRPKTVRNRIKQQKADTPFNSRRFNGNYRRGGFSHNFVNKLLKMREDGLSSCIYFFFSL